MKIQLHRRHYKFNLAENAANPNLLDCIKHFQEIIDLIKEKEERKLPEINDVCNYTFFNEVEYLLHTTQIENNFKKEQQSKSFATRIFKVNQTSNQAAIYLWISESRLQSLSITRKNKIV